MKILKQIGIIFIICWVSLAVSRLLPFPFAPGIIGMIFVLVLLMAGILRIEHIREKSSFLLSNMAFFLVPAGVSVMNHLGLIGRNVLILAFICIVSTIITFAATALTVKALLLVMGRLSVRRAGAKDGGK
ncbi:MAG: CidA/LrgA family protein [Treponema sp.]|jgi:holin-like protein|nr:CidA/LrgA family protein [Treponema sp.]